MWMDKWLGGVMDGWKDDEMHYMDWLMDGWLNE